MESLLHAISHHIALALQATAIFVVAFGSLRALVDGWHAGVARHAGTAGQRTVWLHYARWLVAGLTFQLAADIVETSFSPTWDEVGRLAAVAAVRTFLSYFLDREVEQTEASGRAVRARHRREVVPVTGEPHERYE